MGRLWLVLVLAMLVLALTPVLATAGPVDDAGSVVDRWVMALISMMLMLVSFYALDAILLGSTGLTLKEGSEAIAAISPIGQKRDKVVLDDRKIVVLDDNVSYATGFYEFSVVRNGEMKKSRAGFSMVLVKHANDWLIAHYLLRNALHPHPADHCEEFKTGQARAAVALE